MHGRMLIVQKPGCLGGSCFLILLGLACMALVRAHSNSPSATDQCWARRLAEHCRCSCQPSRPTIYSQFCLRTSVFKGPKLTFSNNHQYSLWKTPVVTTLVVEQ